MSDIKLPEPTVWTMKCELEARETTYRGHLWFTDPVNAGWAPLYTADQLREYAKQAAEDAVLELRKRLEDPHMVHLAMLRGEIGTPDIRDMLHVHGADALSRWDRAEQAAEMERERILDLLNDVQEPEWYGRGHPYTFLDGVIACHRAIRGTK